MLFLLDVLQFDMVLISFKFKMVIWKFFYDFIKFLLGNKYFLLRNMKNFYLHTLKKQKNEINPLKKVHFINVNELKLIQVELFSYFHFKSVAVNVLALFCKLCKQIINAFYAILKFHFEYEILDTCKLASLR